MKNTTETRAAKIHKILMFAGGCALLSAMTTLLLGVLTTPRAEGFDAQVQLANNSQYLASKWTLFIHPQLTFLSFTGLAALYWRSRPELILPAMFFAGIWALLEMLQQGLLIEGLNNVLRQGYLQANDPDQLHELKTSMVTLGVINDSLFFVLLFAIGFAYLLLGTSVALGAPKNYWLATGMFFLTLTSFLSFSGYYLFEAPILLTMSNFLFEWGYSWIAPVFRAYLGIWLIQQGLAARPTLGSQMA